MICELSGLRVNLLYVLNRFPTGYQALYTTPKMGVARLLTS
ncbi:hypothetical protein VS_II1416 [Vibrio atlanticus]|uniref:Uncharacterized protein n=1 Tax=Vibrio atlanticus (strain LGP32) TaxID=575788 RepID=B7VTG2_VIBA3|nr:hypothetical protein VS_II1416 [Vibrio atlanticus]